MATANTQTLATLSTENKEFYQRALLKRLTANLVFAKYGQKKPMPKNIGDTTSFRKFNSLAPATTALTEGVTPDGKALSISEIKATVKQYGDYVTISDKLDFLGIDPVLTETVTLQGEQAGETIDTVVRDIVCAGTNVIYCSTDGTGTEDADVDDKIDADYVLKAVTFLRRENVKPLEGKFYVGIIDPDIAYDLMNDPLWQDVSKYNGGEAILEGEVGRLHGVKFITTTNTKVTQVTVGSSPNQTTNNVHSAMIIGRDAYGVIDVDGSIKPEVIIKGLGAGDDPLNQRQTCGWKTLFTAKVLNELAMIRLQCLTSTN